MRLHTANKHRKRLHRNAVYKAAFVYHMARCARLERKGKLHLIQEDSGFIRRSKRRTKQAFR